ncbi:MAG: DUF3278 domain-containing protein [Vagococcus sp.]
MEKEKLGTRFIKRIYGITGVLDEYKKNEVNRIGNNAFMFLWVYSIVANVVTLFLTQYVEFEILLWGYLLVNCFVLFFGVGLYLMYEIECLGLADQEVEESNYLQAKKKMKKNGITATIIFFIIQLILQGFDYSVKNIFLILVGSIFFGGMMYAIGVANIKK